MESALFKDATLGLALGVEAAAGLVIAVAALQATWRAIGALLASQPQRSEGVRLGLARWLALALEFELAADILRTAVAPTWDEIGQLAAIIVLRTVLNYFLQREIEKEVHGVPLPAQEPAGVVSKGAVSPG